MIKRIIQVIPVVFAVILINFFIIHAAPGDVALYFSESLERPSEVELAAIRRRFGLDQPLWVQLGIYLGKVITFDLGKSWVWDAPVIQVISWRIGATYLLIGTSLVFSLIFGVLLGAYAARKEGGKFDLVSSLTLLALQSTPTFWGGILLMMIFALILGWFPTSGMVYVGKEAGLGYYLDILHHLFLPALSMSIFWSLGVFFRITRSSVIEVIEEDFVKAAEAVGYDEGTVFRKHALRNALLPVITMAGHQMALIFSGAMVTETVFAWPGMGRLIYTAIFSRDFPLIMGCYIVGSISVIIANLVVDLLYIFVDPRVKLE